MVPNWLFSLVGYYKDKVIHLATSDMMSYRNLPWYVYIIQIATNVIYMKVLVITAGTCATFKYNSNMYRTYEGKLRKPGFS